MTCWNLSRLNFGRKHMRMEDLSITTSVMWLFICTTESINGEDSLAHPTVHGLCEIAIQTSKIPTSLDDGNQFSRSKSGLFRHQEIGLSTNNIVRLAAHPTYPRVLTNENQFVFTSLPFEDSKNRSDRARPASTFFGKSYNLKPMNWKATPPKISIFPLASTSVDAALQGSRTSRRPFSGGNKKMW